MSDVPARRRRLGTPCPTDAAPLASRAFGEAKLDYMRAGTAASRASGGMEL